MTKSARPPPGGSALADLIERVRSERGMSLRAVARAAGLSPTTVAELANARPLRQLPRAATLEALARALAIPSDDVHFAAAAAMRGQRVRVYRLRVGPGEVEIKVTLDPGREDLTTEEVERLRQAAATALSEEDLP